MKRTTSPGIINGKIVDEKNKQHPDGPRRKRRKRLIPSCKKHTRGRLMYNYSTGLGIYIGKHPGYKELAIGRINARTARIKKKASK